MKIAIIDDKKILFEIFEKEILSKLTISDICKSLNIHKGTVNRWILKKEVPTSYFNHINKMLNNKYFLNISKEQLYKNMDQFFTPVYTAKLLIKESLNFIEKNFQIDFSEYSLIEPSAGSGNFFFNFPKDKFKEIIGLDIDPQDKKIFKQDWFEFKSSNNKNIIIGNPPFGLRGQLALQFINHASSFCDFICFILPPLFSSNGKGSPMLRVDKDFYLAKQIDLGDIDYLYPNKKHVKINAIFQIWTRLFSKTVKPISPPKKQSEWIKVYSLSNGGTPSSNRNVRMIGKCDFYLPSTTFNKVELRNNFEDLPHKRGYGIVILKNKLKISKIIKNINWSEISFKSTNSANNLRIQLIIEAVEGRVNE